MIHEDVQDAYPQINTSLIGRVTLLAIRTHNVNVFLESVRLSLLLENISFKLSESTLP